jgi:hypothetical protein
MASFERLTRGDELEAAEGQIVLSNELDPTAPNQLSRLKKAALIGAAALTLVAFDSERVNEAELTISDIVAEAAREHTEELRLEQALDAEVVRMIAKAEADTARRDPLENTQEVIILEDVPGIFDYKDYFIQAGKEFDVNPNILAAIAWLESRGDPNVGTSSAGARGYMQIMPNTAEDIQEKTDFGSYDHSDIEDSIRMAAATWSTNRDYYMPILLDGNEAAKNLDVLLASYNWGIGGAEQYVEAGCSFERLPEETQAYFREFYRILSDTPAEVDEEFCLSGEPVSER